MACYNHFYIKIRTVIEILMRMNIFTSMETNVYTQKLNLSNYSKIKIPYKRVQAFLNYHSVHTFFLLSVVRTLFREYCEEIPGGIKELFCLNAKSSSFVTYTLRSVSVTSYFLFPIFMLLLCMRYVFFFVLHNCKVRSD